MLACITLVMSSILQIVIGKITYLIMILLLLLLVGYDVVAPIMIVRCVLRRGANFGLVLRYLAVFKILVPDVVRGLVVLEESDVFAIVFERYFGHLGVYYFVLTTGVGSCTYGLAAEWKVLCRLCLNLFHPLIVRILLLEILVNLMIVVYATDVAHCSTLRGPYVHLIY